MKFESGNGTFSQFDQNFAVKLRGNDWDESRKRVFSSHKTREISAKSGIEPILRPFGSISIAVTESGHIFALSNKNQTKVQYDHSCKNKA